MTSPAVVARNTWASSMSTAARSSQTRDTATLATAATICADSTMAPMCPTLPIPILTTDLDWTTPAPSIPAEDLTATTCPRNAGCAGPLSGAAWAARRSLSPRDGFVLQYPNHDTPVLGLRIGGFLVSADLTALTHCSGSQHVRKWDIAFLQ